MSKGKNFTAAEKHFEKKRIELRREINDMESEIKTITLKSNGLYNRVLELEQENLILKDWVERLLEYTELSKEDIKAVCDADKRKVQSGEKLVSILSFMNGIAKF